MYGINSVECQQGFSHRNFDLPATSCVKMICAGPKTARSNVGKAVGEPSHTKLSVFSDAIRQ